MTRQALTTILLLAFAVSACGKDTHESIFLEQKALANEIGDTLATITDVASAKAHKSTLESLGARYQALKARSEKLPQPTPEERKTLMDRISNDKDLQDIAMKVQGAMARIQMDPVLSAELKGIDLQKLLR